MKKFLMRVICLMLPVGIVVSAVNALVDPAALFIRGRDIYELAEYMCGGGIVVGNTNINERELLKSVIKAQEKEPDIIAVGSSRIMYVDSSLVASNVKQGSFRNHGLSGGGLYDCIAVLGAYDAYRGSLPKTVIIGADPWLFDRYDPGDRYSEMADEIEHMQNVIAGVENTGGHSIWQEWRPRVEKLTQLFSVTYFQSSLKYAINNSALLQKQYSYADNEDETDGALRRADGSIRNAIDYMNRSPGDVSGDVNWRVVLKEINRTSYYPELDKSMQREFEEFVEYLQEQGVEVIFYLAPFHPAFYELFCDDADYAGMIRSEDYLLEYAQKCGISVYGSYNPEALGLSEESFLDGVHLRDYEQEKALVLRK